VYLQNEQVGLMLADVGQAGLPQLQPLVGLPPGTAQALVMGTSRWLFWWVLPHQLATVSNVDGGDLRIVAKSDPQNGPVGELGDPVSAGDYFLYHQWVDNTNTPGTHWEIAITDGVSQGKPYLVPPLGESYASPVYAHSHIAWMRGIHMKGVNLYDSVEVWASPWSPVPSKLQPKKLGDYPLTSTAEGVGGWGYYLTPTSPHDALLWDLATGGSRKLTPPSNIQAFWRPFGITRKHLWTSGRDDQTVNRGDYLLRYTLKP
jgi:hypothetical protein